MTEKRKLVLLVDADFFAYMAAAACSRVVEWEDGILEPWADLNEGEAIFESSMQAIRNQRKEFADAPIILTWTDKVNWRKAIWPDYKRQRGSKPLAYWNLKARVDAKYESFERPTLEGDDCLGILATAPRLVNAERAVIVSCDKDFNTIPGEFFWWDSYAGKHQFKKITEEQADRWHMYQTLMGDMTDGYPGLPGCGKGTAEEFLQDPYIAYQEERILKSGPRKGQVELQWKTRPLAEGETRWDGIVSLYAKAGLTEADAIIQAQVARICRAEDFDLRNKCVIPWQPRKE